MFMCMDSESVLAIHYVPGYTCLYQGKIVCYAIVAGKDIINEFILGLEGFVYVYRQMVGQCDLWRY